ncbi:MAG: hypothetical protein HY727_09820 [Candidatus Rokubacteria bacterium]|nr:hypothetical protein [Candidatus Rokubacteria bacterium]
MPDSLRRFAWWAFLGMEVVLVAASTAYVGFGTWKFWLVVLSAVLALIGYVVTVRTTPEPTLGDARSAPQRWYWF